MELKIKNVSGDTWTCGTIELANDAELVIFNDEAYNQQIKDNYDGLSQPYFEQSINSEDIEVYKDDGLQSVTNAFIELDALNCKMTHLNCMIVVYPLFQQLNS